MIGQTISAEVGWPDRHRPESRIRFSPAGLAMSGRGIQLCPMHAPWRPEHLAAASVTASSLICIPTCLATKWPSSPCQPEQLAASASRLYQAALTGKSADRLLTAQRAWPRKHLPCQVQPHSEGRVMRGSLIPGLPETLKGGSTRRTSALEAVLLSAIPVKRTAAASDLLCSFWGFVFGFKLGAVQRA